MRFSALRYIVSTFENIIFTFNCIRVRFTITRTVFIIRYCYFSLYYMNLFLWFSLFNNSFSPCACVTLTLFISELCISDSTRFIILSHSENRSSRLEATESSCWSRWYHQTGWFWFGSCVRSSRSCFNSWSKHFMSLLIRQMYKFV